MTTLAHTNASVLAFRDWLLPRMIDSIERTETRAYRREGCLLGVEYVRKLDSPQGFIALLNLRHKYEHYLAFERHQSGEWPAGAYEDYWRYRCATAQVEYVWERLRLAWELDYTVVSAHSVVDWNVFLHEAESPVR